MHIYIYACDKIYMHVIRYICIKHLHRIYNMCMYKMLYIHDIYIYMCVRSILEDIIDIYIYILTIYTTNIYICVKDIYIYNTECMCQIYKKKHMVYIYIYICKICIYIYCKTHIDSTSIYIRCMYSI
jgi:hypothetical protein